MNLLHSRVQGVSSNIETLKRRESNEYVWRTRERENYYIRIDELQMKRIVAVGACGWGCIVPSLLSSDVNSISVTNLILFGAERWRTLVFRNGPGKDNDWWLIAVRATRLEYGNPSHISAGCSLLSFLLFPSPTFYSPFGLPRLLSVMKVARDTAQKGRENPYRRRN